MTAEKMTQMQYTMRTARDEADYWLLRQFLIDTWQPDKPFFNWEIRRLDGAYLVQDIEVVFAVLDHLLNPADLPIDAP